MNNLDAVIVDVDDFCQTFLLSWETHLISSGIKQRNKLSRLSVSEVMTIVIAFHQSEYQDFKAYYIHFLCRYLTNEFPELVSYPRMCKPMQSVLVPLCFYLTHRQVMPIGIAFVDSFKLLVCHNLRILRHHVFKGTEKLEKGMMWWF
ncbi:Mobile element protein [Candidatus Enterovibrio escicola]|uniref:Mobile element protein n=1 Tax=Candidatus Enterovibrio escicola TaxID=1927127 RepID=A0A2A5T0C8_9GAMM|nr:transposase [Candidatus Enterovibrio escacola]PCS21613.1 Mobile element protein [Candidatus Enterovibrio escacola]